MSKLEMQNNICPDTTPHTWRGRTIPPFWLNSWCSAVFDLFPWQRSVSLHRWQKMHMRYRGEELREQVSKKRMMKWFLHQRCLARPSRRYEASDPRKLQQFVPFVQVTYLHVSMFLPCEQRPCSLAIPALAGAIHKCRGCFVDNILGPPAICMWKDAEEGMASIKLWTALLV